MIISIDKTKEVTRQEYMDLSLRLGNKMSLPRISQLIKEGSLITREYAELGNLEMIVLNDNEQSLAQTVFSTTQPIHNYSHKQLGDFFGKLVLDISAENSSLKGIFDEKNVKIDSLSTDFLKISEENTQLTKQNLEVNSHNEALQTEFDDMTTKHEQLHLKMVQASQENQALSGELLSTKNRIQELERENFELKITANSNDRLALFEQTFMKFMESQSNSKTK